MTTQPSMAGRSWRRSWAVVRVTGCLLMMSAGGLLVGIIGAAPGNAQVIAIEDLLRSSPSDARATFHDGNAVLCGQVGFPNDDQVGAFRNNGASDGNVSGSAAPNSGTIQTGQGEELNVTVINQ